MNEGNIKWNVMISKRQITKLKLATMNGLEVAYNECGVAYNGMTNPSGYVICPVSWRRSNVCGGRKEWCVFVSVRMKSLTAR